MLPDLDPKYAISKLGKVALRLIYNREEKIHILWSIFPFTRLQARN